MNKHFFGFSFFILAILASIIFFQKERPRNVRAYWKQWDRLARKENPGRQRAPAESSSRQCLTTESLPQNLKKRIDSLDLKETSTGQEIISGLHLDRLTQKEANFLKIFTPYIHSSLPEAEECQSLPCFFEKVYKQKDQFEGLSIYDFYLETGYAIASSSNIPNMQKQNDYPDSQYLFSRKELNYFNEVALKISPVLKFMPSLNTIHRLPEGFVLDPKDKSCAKNRSNDKQGYIIIADDCLKPNEGITTIVHEMTHSLDKIILQDYSKFSESNEWLDLSGWFVEENKDSSGKIERQWNVQKSKDNDDFVDLYASESPQEDFAESLGFFISDPRRLRKSSPKKFNLIKKRFFNGRSFDEEGQIEWYGNQLSLELGQKFSEIMKNCVQDKKFYPPFNIEITEMDNGVLGDDLLACLKGGMKELQSKKIDEIAGKEINVCDFFAKYDNSLITENVKKFASSIKAHLGDETKLAQEQLEYDEFQRSVLEEVEPREFLLDCFRGLDPNKCYADKVSAAISLSAKNFPEISPLLVEKQTNYFLKHFSYEIVKNDSIRLFRSLFDQSTGTLLRWAQERWDSCMKRQSPSEGELLIPFSGDGQFVARDMLTCLNFNAASEVLSILMKRAKRLGFTELSSPNNDFLLEIYLPVSLNLWQSETIKNAEIETQSLAREKELIALRVEKSMAKDLRWVPSQNRSPQNLLASCQSEGQKILLEELSKNPAFLKLKFNLNTLMAGTMSNELCEKVMKSTPVIETNKKSAATRNEELQKSLLSYLDLRWIEAEKSCLHQLPQIKKKKDLSHLMQLCLEKKKTWQEASDLAFKALREESSLNLSAPEENSLQKWFAQKASTLRKKALEKSILNLK